MSGRSLFFHSLSVLYHHRCADILDGILAQTDGLVEQLQHQMQARAPFWHLLLRADGTIVQACIKAADYHNGSPQSLVGQNLYPLCLERNRQALADLVWRVAESGQSETAIFPTKCCDMQFGTVFCRVPWLQDQAGEVVCLLWSLEDERSWSEFAFRSFDGLRVIMLLDTRGHILATDPVTAGRLGGTPRTLAGQYLFGLFPPDKARQRWVSFCETAWMGHPVEWMERGESGVLYDMYRLPVFGRNGYVVRVLLLARERERVFNEVPVVGQASVIG